MEDKALCVVARLDGTPFPSSAQLAWRWARGRLPRVREAPSTERWFFLGSPRRPEDQAPADTQLETAYCAEVVAVTYEDMGLLPHGKQPSWYDPGRFWSGDTLVLRDGYRLGEEIAVEIPLR
jgi:hypothetical protein